MFRAREAAPDGYQARPCPPDAPDGHDGGHPFGALHGHGVKHVVKEDAERWCCSDLDEVVKELLCAPAVLEDCLAGLRAQVGHPSSEERRLHALEAEVFRVDASSTSLAQR